MNLYVAIYSITAFFYFNILLLCTMTIRDAGDEETKEAINHLFFCYVGAVAWPVLSIFIFVMQAVDYHDSYIQSRCDVAVKKLDKLADKTKHGDYKDRIIEAMKKMTDKDLKWIHRYCNLEVKKLEPTPLEQAVVSEMAERLLLNGKR